MSAHGSRFGVSMVALLLLVWIAAPASADEKVAKPKKDKGEASMSIGLGKWSASRASAYKREGRLKILASRSKTVDGKRHRDSLTLVIKDFDGPGTYELTGMNSNFTSVGLNLGGLEGGDEGASDAAAEQLLRDALSGSKVLLLQGAQVEIRSVDAKQVEGRFSWKDPTGRSSLTDGVFRAIVKKPRKKKERKRE